MSEPALNPSACAAVPTMRLLFVCMGNICRSPTAEGVMAHILDAEGLAQPIEIDSAGTGAWHVGEPPDRRSTAAARRRGVALDGRARQVTVEDLDHFDLILAADAGNRRDLLRLAGDDPQRRDRIHLLREFDPEAVRAGDLEVPDPYYGGGDGFEHVLDVVESACRGLLNTLRAQGRV